jgi:hypothetical protein
MILGISGSSLRYGPPLYPRHSIKVTIFGDFFSSQSMMKHLKGLAGSRLLNGIILGKLKRKPPAPEWVMTSTLSFPRVELSSSASGLRSSLYEVRLRQLLISSLVGFPGTFSIITYSGPTSFSQLSTPELEAQESHESEQRSTSQPHSLPLNVATTLMNREGRLAWMGHLSLIC